MDRVVSYFKFLYNVTDFSTVNKKVAKEIDDFQFPSSPEFLVVESTRNEVANGHHVEWFNAKNEIISAGKAISNFSQSIFFKLLAISTPTIIKAGAVTVVGIT